MGSSLKAGMVIICIVVAIIMEVVAAWAVEWVVDITAEEAASLGGSHPRISLSKTLVILIMEAALVETSVDRVVVTANLMIVSAVGTEMELVVEAMIGMAIIIIAAILTSVKEAMDSITARISIRITTTTTMQVTLELDQALRTSQAKTQATRSRLNVLIVHFVSVMSSRMGSSPQTEAIMAVIAVTTGGTTLLRDAAGAAKVPTATKDIINSNHPSQDHRSRVRMEMLATSIKVEEVEG